ncbi:hypothetical protein RHGRI_032763 [Rhododendron griersonianum]|uniref:Uncharacterized protein n=1 Tax=Rhododendron griersonianum TaxID=479676 RepID=A0AAV6IDM5_9ERIC|nr:hypothetical protein RHGRI_032763 [Rhododendron griersonianum]
MYFPEHNLDLLQLLDPPKRKPGVKTIIWMSRIRMSIWGLMMRDTIQAMAMLLEGLGSSWFLQLHRRQRSTGGEASVKKKSFFTLFCNRNLLQLLLIDVVFRNRNLGLDEGYGKHRLLEGWGPCDLCFGSCGGLLLAERHHRLKEEFYHR